MPNRIKALILDMDGVLWRDSQPIGDLPAIFARIRARGLRFMLASNNSTSTVEAFIGRLRRFGVEAAPENIMTSSLVTAAYLEEQYPSGAWLYVVGEEGLRRILQGRGFRLLDTDAKAPRPAAVVVGMDRQVTYAHLRRATAWIRAGVPFLGTNPDRTYPTPEGLAPGAGSILAAIETASDVAPRILGKPYPEMYRRCLERMGTAPEETVMVGDRLETDIAGAQPLGIRTALVLSGVTTPEEAAAHRPAPDWIVEDLAALLERLP